MERIKEDRRIRITKLAIRESLIELMQEQPISKISVKMLCEAADINRSTFYAHYKDQYALLIAIQQEIIADVKERVFSAQFLEASDSGISVLVKVLEYGKANAPLLKVLLSENGDFSFQHELMLLAQEKIIEEFQGERSLPPRIIQYLKRFALDGLLSIMRHWLDENCADDPQMLASLMVKLLVYGTNGLYPYK
jgi:AcrR family transcriptional regulator